jgi:1-acyl-sn-glycerol-3-phosphate acyltransferase
MDILKTPVFLAVAVSSTIYHSGMSAFVHYKNKLVNNPKTTHACHKVATKWAQTILNYTPGWEINISGQENLLSDGTPCVIVANHESSTDILAMYYLGVQFRWLAKKEIFSIPLVGKSMKWAGYVPLDRSSKESALDALKISADWLKSGTPMFFFPEGTRSTTGKVKKFKPGAFKLAIDCNVPIVPVVIKGAGNLLKKGSMQPNSATVLVKILPKITARTDETVEQFSLRTQEIISTEHSQLGV